MFWNSSNSLTQGAAQVTQKTKAEKGQRSPIYEPRTKAVAGAQYKVAEPAPHNRIVGFGIAEKQLDQVLFHRVRWLGEIAPFTKRSEAQRIVNDLNAQSAQKL